MAGVVAGSSSAQASQRTSAGHARQTPALGLHDRQSEGHTGPSAALGQPREWTHDAEANEEAFHQVQEDQWLYPNRHGRNHLAGMYQSDFHEDREDYGHAVRRVENVYRRSTVAEDGWRTQVLDVLGVPTLGARLDQNDDPTFRPPAHSVACRVNEGVEIVAVSSAVPDP